MKMMISDQNAFMLQVLGFVLVIPKFHRTKFEELLDK